MTGVDTPDQLRERYRHERDKRLRPDGNDQYIQPVGRFAHYLDDVWAEVAPREPLVDEVTFAFIGGGFAGLVVSARVSQVVGKAVDEALGEAVDDIRIIEKGGDFGGTWYWNRYPGAMCDTTSFVYMPLLEETGHMPSEKYAHGPEILDHARRIGHHYGLYDSAVLSTEVTSLDWDDNAKRWIISTNRGDAIRARFVAIGAGPLHRPKLPGIVGIETYGGHSFHTSRWDYGYTGGDPAGAPMTNLADKRVGIIGTGATAVQCIPHLARSSGELTVFQRTPSSVDVRNNAATDAEWFAALRDGWQQEWLENFTTLQTGGFVDEDLTMDGWTDLAQRIRDKAIENGDFTPEGLTKAYHDSDDEKMVELRARVDQVVNDPVTAESLKAWYRQLCKRPCFHDEYLQAFNRPNVTLVNTDGRGVERIDETGVWANGEHHELDVIIYASGFEVGTDYARRCGFETTGRDGRTLTKHWADGMISLHGIHMHGFPNLFLVGPNQGANLISNVPHNFVERAQTIAAVLTHALDVDATEVEVTAEAEAAWVKLLEDGGRTFGNDPDCTPGYYNNEGQLASTEGRRNFLGFPDGPMAYFAYIDQWRSTGRFEGLEFR